MMQSGPRSQRSHVEPRWPALPRARYFGRFFILRRLAEGGFGTVYEAADIHTGQQFALKIPLLDNERAFSDFWNEVRILRALEHPNVIPLVYAGVIDGITTIVYPLGDVCLARRLRQGMWPGEAVTLARQLLRGLGHVHERGYLHCDLKPGNMILFPGEQLRISDFGLARERDEGGVSTTSGTVDYMAPEHKEGCVSTRSDVYEAALVIVEMLTGWVVTEPGDVSLQEWLPDSDWAYALDPVIRRALDPKPHARYFDGSEFAVAFEHALKFRTVH